MNGNIYKHIVEHKEKQKICARHPVSHWKEGYKRCYWGFKLNQDCEQLPSEGGDIHTGQYFNAVNKTKKEYVRPWDIGGGAKLWEWCVNPTAGIFPYLLRKSNEGGGGDVLLENPRFAGRWAGNEVYLVGDYDESKLFDIAESEYHNISKELAQEYNQFVELEDRKLRIKR